MTISTFTRRRLLLTGLAAAVPVPCGLPALAAGDPLRDRAGSPTGNAAAGDAAADPQAMDELKIGLVLSYPGNTDAESARSLYQAVDGARMGLWSAHAALERQAAKAGRRITIFEASAPSPSSVERAARRLVDHDGVAVLVGGFDAAEAQVLSRVAAKTGTLFLNIAASDDALRTTCRPTTFHIEASASMYLRAIAQWFVPAGHRRWHLVRADTDDGAAKAARFRQILAELDGPTTVAGESRIAPGSRDYGPILRDVGTSKPDIVLLLTDWLAQIDFLADFEASGLTAAVTGFPEPAAQTREFYALSRQAAPVAGTGHRVASWDATFAEDGAKTVNERFAIRWLTPMDPTAFAAYQALTIAFDAATQAKADDGRALAGRLASGRTGFDSLKGGGARFDARHQLRQPLFLVKLNPPGEPSTEVAYLNARASFVTELPGLGPSTARATSGPEGEGAGSCAAR